MAYSRNYYQMPEKDSIQFRILRALTNRKNQPIARIAKRLNAKPETISRALFRGSAEKFEEPNLLMSGLVNFKVSGTKKPHFRLNLSFTGFLWYLLEESPERIGIETFNEVKRLYNNFGYPLLMEHNALEHLFFLQYYDSRNNEPSSLPQQADPISQKPGKYLLTYYKNELLRKFFRYDYFESYPPLDVLLIGLYLMIPDDIIDTKTSHQIDQMIEDYSPKFLQPLLRCLYERKEIIRKGIINESSSSSSPSWLVSHHHITSAANRENDEIAKIEFAMLFLSNSDLLYPLVNSKKYRSIAKRRMARDHDQQQPVMSIELMYEISGFIENVLSQHVSQWKNRKKTLRRIKEMILSSSAS
jgi:hypothetical protein